MRVFYYIHLVVVNLLAEAVVVNLCKGMFAVQHYFPLHIML